jgi:hypothetical protein
MDISVYENVRKMISQVCIHFFSAQCFFIENVAPVTPLSGKQQKIRFVFLSVFPDYITAVILKIYR